MEKAKEPDEEGKKIGFSFFFLFLSLFFGLIVFVFGVFWGFLEVFGLLPRTLEVGVERLFDGATLVLAALHHDVDPATSRLRGVRVVVRDARRVGLAQGVGARVESAVDEEAFRHHGARPLVAEALHADRR